MRCSCSTCFPWAGGVGHWASWGPGVVGWARRRHLHRQGTTSSSRHPVLTGSGFVPMPPVGTPVSQQGHVPCSFYWAEASGAAHRSPGPHSAPGNQEWPGPRGRGREGEALIRATCWGSAANQMINDSKADQSSRLATAVHPGLCHQPMPQPQTQTGALSAVMGGRGCRAAAPQSHHGNQE